MASMVESPKHSRNKKIGWRECRAALLKENVSEKHTDQEERPKLIYKFMFLHLVSTPRELIFSFTSSPKGKT